MRALNSTWIIASVAVCGFLSSCSCGGEGAAQDVFLQARPRAILDTGEVTVITGSTNDTKSQPGKGTLHLQSTAGSLKNGVDLTLDGDGLAKTDFTCVLADDPQCVGTVVITGTWTAGGVTATAETKVTILVEPLRGACEPGFERPVDILKSMDADIQLVVAPAVSERAALNSNGTEVGLAFFDPMNGFGGFAISRPPFGGGSDEEVLGRDALGSIGTVSNPLTQTYRSWDLYSGSVRATYELESTDNLKAVINSLAAAFNVGGTLSGGLAGSSTAVGPFKVIVTYVRRVARTVVVLTIAPVSSYNERLAGLMDNVAGGTSLGQADDTVSPGAMVPCEFKTVVATEKIDFLWVVDDSCSMASSQDAVYTAGTTFSSRLASAGLDWRVAASTTGYYPTRFEGSFRNWSTSAANMLTWFDSANMSWFGTNGDGRETGLLGLTSFVQALPKPGTSAVPGPIRSDAQLQVIFLTDAPDQSGSTAAETLEAVRDALQPGQRFVAHGIRCPLRETCGDSPVDRSDEYLNLAELTGGVVGDIRTFNVSSPTPAQRARQGETMAAILRSAIAGAGQQLAGFPIASSVRVAINRTIGPCTKADVPRSAEDGWDLDPSTGKLIIYGSCAPAPGATMAVSYRSFGDTSPETVPVFMRDAGVPIEGDGGVSLTLVPSKPILYRGINDTVEVKARLSGVSPNLGQSIDFTTTAGAFLTSSDGGTSTTLSAPTGPGGVVGVTLIESGASGIATISANHAMSGLAGSTNVEIRTLQQVSHISTSCGSSANCTLMGVKQSGYNEVAQVVFRVTDAMGRPAEGIPVTFSASSLPSGATLTPSAISNAAGDVTASVQSGGVLGTFTIVAVVIPGSVQGSSPTLAIRGARPANKQFRLVCTTNNLAAYKAPDPPLVQNTTCTVRLVDRNNNPVGTGLPVSLKVEAGTVGNSVATAPYSNNNPNEGSGTFTFDTVGGTWPPVDTEPFGAEPSQALFSREAEPSRVSGSRTRNPRDGLITIMAYVVGEEHFDDDNANGVYDLGERFVDQGEPFVDSNDNNVWDPGEIMVPELVNGVDNGVWDGPNGVYDRNKIIWTETKLLMTNNAEPGLGTIEGTSPGFCPSGVPKGSATEFSVYLPDMNLNRVIGGASLSFSRVGTRGAVSWQPNATLIDDYGFEFDRIRVNADAPTQLCVEGTTIRCMWKSVFGSWGRGFVSKLRVTGAPTTDMTACANELGLAADVTVLGTTVRTLPTAFGVQ